jgi:hypothetical protein
MPNPDNGRPGGVFALCCTGQNAGAVNHRIHRSFGTRARLSFAGHLCSTSVAVPAIRAAGRWAANTG